MPNFVTEIMIADAKKYLLPKLQRITPYDTGVLKKNLDVVENEGTARSHSLKNEDHLVNKIDLTVNGYLYRVLVGAVKHSGHDPHPSVYGRDLYNENPVFRRYWEAELRRYEIEFPTRIKKAIGQKLGLLRR